MIDKYTLLGENPDYLTKQLITYIGNKRLLLPHIGMALEKAKRRLGKQKLSIADLFSGSGVVSRYFKAHAELLISNDIEDYAAVVSRCYLTNRSAVPARLLADAVDELNRAVLTCDLPMGFIEELYAPKDEANITKNDRVFYTKENAKRIDNYRRLIEQSPPDLRALLLGPLLSKAAIHTNTAGVFKGFYKNRQTGVGQFGGTGSHALKRILGRIELEPPVLSAFECEYRVFQEDANALAKVLEPLDLVYIDPPYNQHPYGSNYFMLNLITNYKRPDKISKVSGIPVDWKRSDYNHKDRSPILLRDLFINTKASFLLISYNNEGFVSPQVMHKILNEVGRVEVMEIPYNTFRGCRNLQDRSIHVTEYLFLVEKN